MSEYEFDAHIVVEGFKTKQDAADEILETLVDADIACSLHESRTLNVKSKDAEIERLKAHIQEHQSRDALQQMEIERLTDVKGK